jgi:hypothetical protein
LKCAVGVRDDDQRLVKTYRRFLEWEIVNQPFGLKVVDRAMSPVLGKSYIVYARKATRDVTVDVARVVTTEATRKAKSHVAVA